MHTFTRLSLGLGLALAGLGLPPASADEAPYAGPLAAGTLELPAKHESSGLAVSRRMPDILWTHNDSGGAPVLFALDTAGRKRGTLRITGVKNEDWEDIASFQRDGKAWLLIADTGDNDAERKSVWLHVIEEPEASRLSPGGELSVAPAYSLRLRYEDGPRDCESVTVDPTEGAVYLLTKRDEPPRLYRVPLARAAGDVVAKFVGPVGELEGTTVIDTVFKRVAGKRAAWPTGLEFAADGRAAVVLTYAGPAVFERRGTEPWSDTLRRTPARLLFHGLPQAEGVCFSSDGHAIYVISESAPNLVRYDRKR